MGPQPSQGSTTKGGQDPHSAPNGGASSGPGFPHMEGGVHENHAGVPSGLTISCRQHCLESDIELSNKDFKVAVLKILQ